MPTRVGSHRPATPLKIAVHHRIVSFPSTRADVQNILVKGGVDDIMPANYSFGQAVLAAFWVGPASDVEGVIATRQGRAASGTSTPKRAPLPKK